MKSSSLFPLPSSLFPLPSSLSHKGFTLIEMLVVIGIIAVLIGATMGGYSFATRHAQKARGREAVSNAATALSILFQRQNRWPPKLAHGAQAGKPQLTADAAACLAANGLMSLSYTTVDDNGEKVYRLSGLDRCGIVDPWAMEVLKRLSPGDSGLNAKVPSGGEVQDHILYYALDEDGDGITVANVGGVTLNIRATAVVWSCGLDGVVSPYPYSGNGGGGGGKGQNKNKSGKLSDDIYSWAPHQVEK